MGIREYERNLDFPLKPATVLLLLRDNEVLLAMKRRGFGVGKWNGVGGKPEENEDIVTAAIRESQEEIGVTPINPEKVALFKYMFPHDKFGMHVWIFTATKWKGKPTKTEEMDPKWFPISKVPYGQMWSDDKYWMPRVLAGEKLTGSFLFDENGEITDYYMDEVKEVK